MLTEDDFREEELAASCIAEQEKATLISVNDKVINYENDWIVDSACSNHMTGDEKILSSITEEKGKQMVITANNSKLPITHIGETEIVPRYSRHPVQLHNVYHVPGMKKNQLSVSQLVASGNYVVLGPNDVKIERKLKAIGALG